MVAEGLKISLAASCVAKNYVPACLIQASGCTALGAHTFVTWGSLATSIKIGKMETSLIVSVWRQLRREGVQDVLRKAGQEMFEHVVSIVGVDAGSAACYTNAMLTAGPDRFEGEGTTACLREAIRQGCQPLMRGQQK